MMMVHRVGAECHLGESQALTKCKCLVMVASCNVSTNHQDNGAPASNTVSQPQSAHAHNNSSSARLRHSDGICPQPVRAGCHSWSCCKRLDCALLDPSALLKRALLVLLSCFKISWCKLYRCTQCTLYYNVASGPYASSPVGSNTVAWMPSRSHHQDCRMCKASGSAVYKSCSCTSCMHYTTGHLLNAMPICGQDL